MSDQEKAPKRKRRWGNRRDAALCRDVPGLQSIMCHIWPKRTDCEVYLNNTLDVTELMRYLQEKNAEHPDYKTTVFHAFLFAIGRMIGERPKMNRFIQGRRMYERFEISLSFVAKRRFADNAEEALLFFTPQPDDTLASFSRKIVGDVKETKKSEHATGGVDQMMDKLMKLPHPIISLFARLVRLLDYFGINPKALTAGDPNYSTALCSNLGSIGCPAVYHHLGNYGTCSILATLGTIHKEEVLQPDGSKAVRDVVDFGVTLDERIADGFYFARSLKLVRYMFDHPESFDLPISEPSGFVYQ